MASLSTVWRRKVTLCAVTAFVFLIAVLNETPGELSFRLTGAVANIAPSQAQDVACSTVSSVSEEPVCDGPALADINHARSVEGLGQLALPSGYYSQTMLQQVVTVTNLERQARGRSKLAGPDSALYPAAQAGAATGNDPNLPSNYLAAGSNWAGTGDPLSADYLWMYYDGPNSANVDCTSPGAPLCYGHRNNILDPSYNDMGAGAAACDGVPLCLTQLFVEKGSGTGSSGSGSGGSGSGSGGSGSATAVVIPPASMRQPCPKNLNADTHQAHKALATAGGTQIGKVTTIDTPMSKNGTTLECARVFTNQIHLPEGTYWVQTCVQVTGAAPSTTVFCSKPVKHRSKRSTKFKAKVYKLGFPKCACTVHGWVKIWGSRAAGSVHSAVSVP